MLYDSSLDTSLMVKLTEAERMVVVHGWGRGGMGNCLRGMEVQFCKMKCSGDEWDDGSTL